jgi:hypothetical protein
MGFPLREKAIERYAIMLAGRAAFRQVRTLAAGHVHRFQDRVDSARRSLYKPPRTAT